MVGCSYPFLADKFLESLLFTAMTDSWIFYPFTNDGAHVVGQSTFWLKRNITVHFCYYPFDTPHTLSDLEFAKQQGQQCDYGETSAACCSKLLSVMPPPPPAMRLALQRNGGTNLSGGHSRRAMPPHWRMRKSNKGKKRRAFSTYENRIMILRTSFHFSLLQEYFIDDIVIIQWILQISSEEDERQ